ncbi:hypothetical protein GF402_05085 [Candidatus Fermentibacteria bacterium]|nr:hypothetical protein [Candidatus Fermentibacteria bacterium]
MEYSSLIDKVKMVITKPRDFFERAVGEPVTLPELIRSYVVVLAAVPAVGHLIGLGVVGRSFMGHHVTLGMKYTIPYVILWYLLTVVMAGVVSFLSSKLAPNFGGKEDLASSAKAVIYSYTPAWVAGVFYIIPALGWIALVAGLYSLYLLYLSAGIVIGVPENKKVGFVVILVVASVVAWILVGAIAQATMPGPARHVF